MSYHWKCFECGFMNGPLTAKCENCRSCCTVGGSCNITKKEEHGIVAILNRENMIEHTPESDKLIQLRRLLRTTRDALRNKAEVWNRDAEAMEEIVREESEDFSVFDAVQIAECEERAKVFRECIAEIQPLICLIDSNFNKL